MTNPTHYIVPAEPTEEMTAQGEANNYGGDDSFNDWASDNAYKAMLAASPNAGKVTKDQFNDLVNLLHDAAHDGNRFDEAVLGFLHALGLEVEGE
ncbi:hypothetical protein QMT40_001799 [Parvibaculaceae bacterium PLY_AMNH_Bact1]|nr:hypothetical protein QMT40_001799 [Parvibaculaceae bacterium PLY_AMNH_Bact1]